MLNKKDKDTCCHHAYVFLVVAILLGSILLALVFLTGMMVGLSKTSYHKGGDYQNKSCSYALKDHIAKKKNAYFNYQLVTELNADGFVAKDAKGNIMEYVVIPETMIYRGDNDDASVEVGDKVYVEASTRDDGKTEASVVKIYDALSKKFIK